MITYVVQVIYLLFQLSAAECDKSVQCVRYPPDCESSKSCLVLVTYKHNPSSQTVDITLASNQSWIGFAQVDVLNSKKMVGVLIGTL